jgi:hypothetical protein
VRKQAVSYNICLFQNMEKLDFAKDEPDFREAIRELMK